MSENCDVLELRDQSMQCVVSARKDAGDWLLAFEAGIVNLDKAFVPHGGVECIYLSDLATDLSPHGQELRIILLQDKANTDNPGLE